MVQKIVFNNMAYNSIEEMPSDVRALYDLVMGAFADNNQDGMPDLFENMQSINTGSFYLQTGSTKIIFDGQTYENIDQLPPEVRQKMENAMGKLDANQNGLPDFIEGMALPQDQTSVSTDFGYGSQTPSPLTPQPAIQNNEPDFGVSRLILVVGIAVIGLCLLALAVYVLFYG